MSFCRENDAWKAEPLGTKWPTGFDQAGISATVLEAASSHCHFRFFLLWVLDHFLLPWLGKGSIGSKSGCSGSGEVGGDERGDERGEDEGEGEGKGGDSSSVSGSSRWSLAPLNITAHRSVEENISKSHNKPRPKIFEQELSPKLKVSFLYLYLPHVRDMM